MGEHVGESNWHTLERRAHTPPATSVALDGAARELRAAGQHSNIVVGSRVCVGRCVCVCVCEGWVRGVLAWEGCGRVYGPEALCVLGRVVA